MDKWGDNYMNLKNTIHFWIVSSVGGVSISILALAVGIQAYKALDIIKLI